MAFDKFKHKRFLERTGSAGTKFKPFYEGIPIALKTGAKSKKEGGFFDIDRVQNKPDKYHLEIDNDTGETALYVERDEEQDRTIQFIRDNFSDAVTASLSASYASKIGTALYNLPPGERVAILSPASIQAPTASVTFSKHPGVDNNVGYLEISNNSQNYSFSHYQFSNVYRPQRVGADGNIPGQLYQHNFLTASNQSHLTRSILKETFLYGQSEPVPKFHFKFGFNGNAANHVDAYNNHDVIAYALTSSLTSSADWGCQASGGAGNNFTASWLALLPDNPAVKDIYYNGMDSSDGAYNIVVMKGLISGDGFNAMAGADESSKAYVPAANVIFYQKTTVAQTVASGSFNYAGNAASSARNSNSSRTLYYCSASLGKGPSGSYTGSFIGNDNKFKSGSHLWADADLRIPAAPGFYHIPGTNEVLGAFVGYKNPTIGSTTPIHTGISSSLPQSSIPRGKTFESVPQWASKSIHN